jgi:hypothetical protein
MSNFCYIHNQQRTINGYCVRCNSRRFPILGTTNEISRKYRQYDQNGRRVINTTSSIGSAMSNFRNQLNIRPASRHVYRQQQNIPRQRQPRQRQPTTDNLRVGFWGNINYPALNELPGHRLTKLDELLLRNTRTFKGEEMEDRNCTICLEKLTMGDTTRILKCMHMYHKECIDQWFKSTVKKDRCIAVKCPLCNTEYKL